LAHSARRTPDDFFEALSLKASISEADSRYRIVHMPELVWGSPRPCHNGRQFRILRLRTKAAKDDAIAVEMLGGARSLRSRRRPGHSGPFDAMPDAARRARGPAFIAQAGVLLKTDCPSYRPTTPVVRIDAMEQRLEAMLHAINIVQPALQNFYGSLSDEQKERFNRLAPAQG
jgi:hypothetical protein